MEKLVSGISSLGLELTARQLEQFQLYAAELVRWNKSVNLTAITSYEQIQTEHFLDSLTVAPVLKEIMAGIPQSEASLIDIGSGAGFPGIPLKILLPEVKLALLDSQGKKTAFLHHIISQLEIRNVEVITARAEDAAHQEKYREQFHIAFSRATGTLCTMVELALPFCRIGGCFMAQKTASCIQAELDDSSVAVELLGGRVQRVQEVGLWGHRIQRLVVLIDKVQSTPEKYPRRSGMPAKHPLTSHNSTPLHTAQSLAKRKATM